MIENRRKNKEEKKTTLNPKHLNWIYWMPLPHNLSCPSGEKKNSVCIVAKHPETSFNLFTWYLRMFEQPYWDGF